jgi:hypothetical protein
MRKYYFGGYTLTFDALEKMSIARTGQTVPVVHDQPTRLVKVLTPYSLLFELSLRQKDREIRRELFW